MKILLFGKNGQVGWELARKLSLLGELVALGRKDADFSNPESLREIVQKVRPDVIVNAAAYTDVNKAEEEEELATVINGFAVGVLAEEAKKLNATLIHYSTDYVFDGAKRSPYTEDDFPRPINAYGRSKMIGENAILKSGCQYLIFRTSWIYSEFGKNFIKTILRLIQEKDKLSIVSDQIGTPTSANLIANVTKQFLQQTDATTGIINGVNEIYNISANGKTSWYEYAQYITETAVKGGLNIKILPKDISSILTEHYKAKAKRPLYSCLDNKKIQEESKLDMPMWERQVKRVVLKLINKDNLH